MKQMKNKRAGIYGRSENISAKNNFIPTNSISKKKYLSKRLMTIKLP